MTNALINLMCIVLDFYAISLDLFPSSSLDCNNCWEKQTRCYLGRSGKMEPCFTESEHSKDCTPALQLDEFTCRPTCCGDFRRSMALPAPLFQVLFCRTVR